MLQMLVDYVIKQGTFYETYIEYRNFKQLPQKTYTFITIYLLIYLLCRGQGRHMCVKKHIWKSENKLQKLILLNHVSAKDST